MNKKLPQLFTSFMYVFDTKLKTDFKLIPPGSLSFKRLNTNLTIKSMQIPFCVLFPPEKNGFDI